MGTHQPGHSSYTFEIYRHRLCMRRNPRPMSIVAKRLYGRPRSWPHCVRWGTSSYSPKGAQPQFSAHVYDGQTAGWIKMPLVTAVGLGTGDTVLDGDPAAPPQKRTVPQFRPMSVVAKRLDGSRCHLVRRPPPRRGDIVLDGDPAPAPQSGTPPQFSVHVCCG